MGRKIHKVEQIIPKLREAEVFIAKGMSVVEASRKIGVADTPPRARRRRMASSALLTHPS